MKDYIVKISMSERVKDPAFVMSRLIEGTLQHHLPQHVEQDKLIGWSSIETLDGTVIATNTILDWGE